MLSLPAEEFDWFDIHGQSQQRSAKPRAGQPEILEDILPPVSVAFPGTSVQKQFFEFAEPLFSVRIIPQSCVIPVGGSKTFRSMARDRNKKPVEENLAFRWEILEGEGNLESSGREIAVFTASQTPGLTRIKVTAVQGEISCSGDGIITVTESFSMENTQRPTLHQGLPGYTYKKAPGELWRSYYHEEQNVIVINNGHRDFVFSSKNKALKIRYIARLFAKELVHKNFNGIPPDELLERMIELTLYMEENL